MTMWFQVRAMLATQPSEELVRMGLFGLGKPDARLYHRIGDYSIVMKDNWIIKDRIAGKKEKLNIGNHGGVSRAEMLVPLVVFRL